GAARGVVAPALRRRSQGDHQRSRTFRNGWMEAMTKHLTMTLLVLGLLANVSLAYTTASKHLDHPDDWYKSDEAKKMADSVLSYQSPRGAWPKNIDTATQPYT